jgi:hypothetical protein
MDGQAVGWREAAEAEGGQAMIECCGQPRSGRFCSECGKVLADGPLWDLLKSCRKSEQQLRTESEKNRKANRMRMAESGMRRAQAWKARGDALAELLAGRPPGKPAPVEEPPP